MNDAPRVEMKKSEVRIIVEIIEYVPNAVLSKTIIKKQQGMSLFHHLMQAKN